MENKIDIFRNAIECFRETETPNTVDYINFISSMNMCFRQGDGILYSDAKEILDDVLDEIDYSFVKLGE
jgi:hypothetical protein